MMNFRDELHPTIQPVSPDLYLYLTFWCVVEVVGEIKRESGPEDDPGLSLKDRKHAG